MSHDPFANADQAVRDAFEQGRAAGRAEAFNELGGQHLGTLLSQSLADAFDAIGSRLHGTDPHVGRSLREYARSLRDLTRPPVVEHKSHAGGVVALRFSDDMDAAKLPEYVSVRNANGGQRLKVSSSWDAARRTLVLTPARQLEAGMKYVVTVDGAARSLSGVPLGDPHEHEFTAR